LSARNNKPLLASKILPNIFLFYGINPSLGVALEICECKTKQVKFSANPTLMSILSVDKAWHPNEV
jgi:formate-dependent nitrite reductase membrane component NrfD